MRYRLLGRTGLYVSEMCLGTMTLGGRGLQDQQRRLMVWSPLAEGLLSGKFKP